MESVKRTETKNKTMQNSSLAQSMDDLYAMGIFAKTFNALKNEDNSVKQSTIAISLLFGR